MESGYIVAKDAFLSLYAGWYLISRDCNVICYVAPESMFDGHFTGTVDPINWPPGLSSLECSALKFGVFNGKPAEKSSSKL